MGLADAHRNDFHSHFKRPAADGRSLHLWRSTLVAGNYIQHTLEQCRDPGRKPRAQSPTAMLDQLKERSRNISLDTHILKQELRRGVGAFLPDAGAPKKRRQAQRKKVRPVKQACSDTVEETISSTVEAVAQRKRARFSTGLSPCPIVHTMTDTSLHLHSTTFRSHDSSSHRTMHHERVTVHWSVLHSLRPKTDDSHESGQASSARAVAEQPGQRLVRWNSFRRGGKSRTRHTRQGLDGCRATERHSQTDQRSWTLLRKHCLGRSSCATVSCSFFFL